MPPDGGSRVIRGAPDQTAAEVDDQRLSHPHQPPVLAPHVGLAAPRAKETPMSHTLKSHTLKSHTLRSHTLRSHTLRSHTLKSHTLKSHTLG